MSLENAHKLRKFYIEILIPGVNTIYILSFKAVSYRVYKVKGWHCICTHSSIE